jgi:diketogulonate reductase-like aldo/keto reductase
VKHRVFGPTGVEVPIIGQGSWDLPESGSRLAEAKLALRRGIELGMTHLDTAEMYGSGAVERIMGDAVVGLPRAALFITSKVLPSNATFEGTIAACERSLKRLKTDYLDCYLLHWPSHVPLEETMRALARLVRDGKTRYAGVSNFDTEDMLEAQRLLGDVPLACNQVLYHLRERGIEHHLLPEARKAGIAIVGYSPFGRSAFPRAAVDSGSVLGKIAAKHDATPRQVILAALTHGEGLFAIPKASSVAHVQENAGAGDLALDDDDMRAIDAAFPIGEPRGLATL